MFGGSSQLPTTAESAVIESLCRVQTTKQCSAVVVSWEDTSNIWLTAAKIEFIGGPFNLRVCMLLKSAVKFDFDGRSCPLLFCIKRINKLIHTWSKVMQWSPQRQTRKDVCRENSLKKHLKVSFQHSWPFCPEQPTPYLIEWLWDHHEFLGLVLWHKQIYLGITLLMFNESCFCICKVPNWIDNSLYLTKLSNAPSRATLRGLMPP